MCKVCGLPEEARFCDECFLPKNKDAPTFVVESTENRKTIIRGVKNPKEILKRLRKMFNCCGKAGQQEIILHGEFSERIRSLIQSSPSLFCFHIQDYLSFLPV